MKSWNSRLIAFFLGTLVVLLFLELGIDYDTLDRRIALAITNLFSGIGFLAIYFFLKRKYQIILPWFIALAVALGVWLDAAGNFAYFYTNLSWWDDLAHFGGTLALAITIFTILHRLNQKGIMQLKPFSLGLFSISLTMLLASFYEITELWGDYLFEMERIGARWDTASDLQWDFIAALVVTLVGSKICTPKAN
jgi:hypothetical protein